MSLVDLSRGSLTEHQTVVVEGDRILHVGPAEPSGLPSGTRIVSRSGGFLMPGLADLHVHLGGEAEMLLFLLNGVTTVRNMWGFSRHLRWRRAVEEGRVLGPTVYTTGPILDGAPPYWNMSIPIATPEEAVLEVRRQKAAGFSAIKVYGGLSQPAYGAIVEEAAAQGLPVVGHVPRAVRLPGVLGARQRSVEHLEGWVDALQSEQAPWKGRAMTREEWPRMLEFMDMGLVPGVAEQVARSESWSCPTLVVYESFCSPAEVAERLARPAMRWCPPSLISNWDPSKDFRFRTMPQAFWDSRADLLRYRRAAVQGLRAAGAKMLVGTDTPNPWVVPGFSLHDELDRLVECGYAPVEVLRMATQGAAEFLDTPKEFGVIAPGARADLLLLGGDPLRELSHARQPRGVMARGHWLAQGELERLSGMLLRSYSTGKVRVQGALSGGAPTIPGVSHEYTIRAFGELVGMERVWEPAAGAARLRHARLVLDAPPDLTTVDSQWSFSGPDETRRLRTKLGFFEGKESIVIVRNRKGYSVRDSTGGASGGRVGQLAVDASALVGPVQVASFEPLVPSLRELGPDAILERDVIRIELETIQVATGRLTAKRQPAGPDTPASPSRYTLEEKWANGTFSGSIELSEDGRILSLHWLGSSQELVWAPSEPVQT